MGSTRALPALGGVGIYKGCGNMKVIEPPGWTNVNDNFGSDGTWVNPVFSPGLSHDAGVQVNNITGILSVRLYACVSTGSATMYSYDFYAYRELGLSNMWRVES